MIRLATWIVVSLILTALIAWLVSLPGTALIEVAGYRMQPRLGMAAFFVAAAAPAGPAVAPARRLSPSAVVMTW